MLGRVVRSNFVHSKSRNWQLALCSESYDNVLKGLTRVVADNINDGHEGCFNHPEPDD